MDTVNVFDNCSYFVKDSYNTRPITDNIDPKN